MNKQNPRLNTSNIWNFVCNGGIGDIYEGNLSLYELVSRREVYKKSYVIIDVYLKRENGKIRYQLWPSKELGLVAYVSKEKLRELYNVTNISSSIYKQIEDELEKELKELEDYFNDNV